MPRRILGRTSPILLLGVLLAATGSAASEDWTTRGGTTSVRLNLATLGDLGVEVVGIDESARPSRPEYFGFAIAGGLRFLAPAGHFERFLDGEIGHAGGFVLRRDGETIDLGGFVLRPASGNGVLELLDAAGRRWLTADNPQAHLVPRQRSLRLVNVDLFLSAELAAWVGRSDLEGLYAGTLDLALPITPPAGFETLGDCEPDLVSPKDLRLIVLDGLSQVAREPDVRVALSLNAKLTNLGPGTIPWYRSIEPDGPPPNVGQHPYLGLQVYRTDGGVLRQIGRSDLKHAFFATNTGCGCPSGHLLFAGCDDTYGVSTNENRHYLAPREEMAASTGSWISLGSHFDAVPVDDFRDHEGESDHDDFEHRLVVAESDLGIAGDFWVEAWYIVQDDPDIFNSMGHRRVAPSLTGGVWSFAFQASLETSSILDTWVDPETPDSDALISGLRVPGGEGHVQLAVRLSPAGAGARVRGTGVESHYEYALMNHDLDSGVTELFIPLPPGSTPTNIGFEDIDDDAGNDWVASVEAAGIRWTAPGGDAQPWGSLFNFRFDLEGVPGVVQASLATGGSAGTIALPTLAPGGDAAGPVLQIQGGCSDPRLRGSGLTPNGRLALYRGGDGSTTPIPASQRCPGMLLSLGEPELITGRTANGEGLVSFGGGPLAGSCGQSFQLVDHSTCAVSNIQLAE